MKAGRVFIGDKAFIFLNFEDYNRWSGNRDQCRAGGLSPVAGIDALGDEKLRKFFGDISKEDIVTRYHHIIAPISVSRNLLTLNIAPCKGGNSMGRKVAMSCPEALAILTGQGRQSV